MPTGFTVSFETNGGSAVTSLTDVTALPELPTTQKTNFKFLGWYYESTFTTEAKKDDTILKDTTLYAKWKRVRMPVKSGSTFTIEYDIDSDGNIIADFDKRKKCKWNAKWVQANNTEK